MSEFHVGQRVRLTRDIYEEGEDVPPGYCGYRGDEVVIKRISDMTVWPYSVAHDGADGSFGVQKCEITALQENIEGRSDE